MSTKSGYKMSDPIIRLAVPGDELGIHTAHMRSIQEVCVKDHGEEEIRGWGFRELGTRWVDPIQKKDVWVIESAGIIQGFGYIRIWQEDQNTKAYLHALYLTPEILGKKFGSRLITLMLDRAKARGARVVELDSSISAYKFYKSFGFTDAGSVKKVDIGGYPVTAHPMRLEW